MQTLYEMKFMNLCYQLSGQLGTPEKTCKALFDKCEALDAPMTMIQCIQHLPAANLPQPNLILGTPAGTGGIFAIGFAVGLIVALGMYYWENK